ncbi:hypothetical protein [Embleya hyalina]|uniref:Uncharacterized protein n=1 Tax=Embleya hyalina TaxID=516124 RepID=A0A401YTE9_9ACTN|nr:hypothetical protein [Embleya hyalina]GCD97852.1 hypothetical protein EHYA_05549 [Embleya hyalina]
MRKLYAMGVMAAAAVFTMVSVSSAQAVATNVQSPGNLAGGRYESSTDTLSMWDNSVLDNDYVRLRVTNVTRNDPRVYTHDGSPTYNNRKDVHIPSTWKSGDKLSLSVCSVDRYRQVARCSKTVPAYV